MRTRGFTLLEVVVSVAILSMVCGVLFTLAAGLGQAANVQQAKIAAVDDVRMAMLQVVRNLRQAAGSTIGTGLPGSSISFRAATDADGNGTAVDIGGTLELSGTRTLCRDLRDLNSDGQTETQLILEEAGQVRVIANGLLPDEDGNGNGALDTGEDANGNGILDRGLWFERAGSGIRITIQTQRAADAHGRLLSSNLVETVVPRN